ncbi:ELMO domain-containing protein 3-like [Physella acuta]|uniref:ELMO domain-containing protein 3-like n=1 Tax=Physella acuta TaxID=109671 RepID=UPI0027DDD4C8|nr:ELMO domain-containing protein 3-like [Physella acuta]
MDTSQSIQMDLLSDIAVSIDELDFEITENDEDRGMANAHLQNCADIYPEDKRCIITDEKITERDSDVDSSHLPYCADINLEDLTCIISDEKNTEMYSDSARGMVNSHLQYCADVDLEDLTCIISDEMDKVGTEIIECHAEKEKNFNDINHLVDDNAEFEDCKKDSLFDSLITKMKSEMEDELEDEFEFPEVSVPSEVKQNNVCSLHTNINAELETINQQKTVTVADSYESKGGPDFTSSPQRIQEDSDQFDCVTENGNFKSYNKNINHENQLTEMQFEENGEATNTYPSETKNNEWENIQTIEPGFAKPGQNVTVAVSESKPLTVFSECWSHFTSVDYAGIREHIKTHVERRGFSAFINLLFGPPKLHRELLQQRDLVFCVAATPFDNENVNHNQILQTIYRCLTGSKFDCQRYGSHWEEIGFQGNDPATDLRGTGMLALAQLLFFLRDQRTKDLARDVYKLSLHPTQNFPFCVMGINLSRICLQVLREDLYNRECNKCGNVIDTLNSVYACLFLKLYNLWKKGKTIADSGFVIRDVETYCRKNSKTLLKDLEIYIKTSKEHGCLGDPSTAELSFFSVCNQEDKRNSQLY